MARPVVSDKDLGFKEILKEINKLTKMEILVGIQEGSITSRESRGHHTRDAGVNIAQYAAQNEFGTREIPQRSFMRSSFDENFSKIEAFITLQYGKVVDGDQTARQAVGLIGQAMTGLVQRKIRAIVFPPNSALTIARKGSSKPLIDFGQMIASIRYVIKTVQKTAM